MSARVERVERREPPESWRQFLPRRRALDRHWREA
jgi:hypothetical protein